MVGLVSPLSVPFPFPSFPFLSFPLRFSSPFFRCLLAQEATALEWSANASDATAATADPSGALGNPETRNISSKSAGRLRSCGVGACLCRWALSRRGVEARHGRHHRRALSRPSAFALLFISVLPVLVATLVCDDVRGDLASRTPSRKSSRMLLDICMFAACVRINY